MDWEVCVLLFFSLFSSTIAASLCPRAGGAYHVTKACSAVAYACELIASPLTPASCNDVCGSFGTVCLNASDSQTCGDTNMNLTCAEPAENLLCYCVVNQPGGVCPVSLASETEQCLSSNHSCVMAVQQGTSCNSACDAMRGYCIAASQTPDCFQRSTRALLCDTNSTALVCQCELYTSSIAPSPYISFIGRGNNTACRALNSDTASSDGCAGPLGCYYDAIQDGSIRNFSDCQARCLNDPDCLGVEYGWGQIPQRCELWNVPSPYFHNATGYTCYDKLDSRLCLEQPVPFPFKLLDDVPCFPMRWGSTCKVTCAAGFVPSEIDMLCDNGEITFPTNVCIKKDVGDSTDSVAVSFALVYDLNATCVGMLSDAPGSSDAIAVAACVGFGHNVKDALNLGTNNPVVTGVTLIDEGALCSLMFSSSQGSNASAIVNEFLALKYANISALTSFNISTVNGVCEVVTDIMKVTISFGSLFAYLTGLPEWSLFFLCGILIVAILVFLYINRRSDHPFALLGAFLSLFSLGGKIVFIAFLSGTYNELKTNAMSQTQFFGTALGIAVGVLAFSFVFNFTCTTLLFRRHALKNYDAFAAWVPKHRCAVALVLLLCGLNPASFLILCSSSFGKDVFKAPVSHRAQNQFQGAGLLSVFIGDGPPIILHVLTLFMVDSDPQLQWGGGTNSILFPLIFSSTAIAVGILRRTILICATPIKIKTMVYERENECTSTNEELRDPEDVSSEDSQTKGPALHVSRAPEASSSSSNAQATPREPLMEPLTPPALRISRALAPNTHNPSSEESVAHSVRFADSPSHEPSSPVKTTPPPIRTPPVPDGTLLSPTAALPKSLSFRIPPRPTTLSSLIVVENTSSANEQPSPASRSMRLPFPEEQSPASRSSRLPPPGRPLLESAESEDPPSPASRSIRLPPPGRPGTSED